MIAGKLKISIVPIKILLFKIYHTNKISARDRTVILAFGYK